MLRWCLTNTAALAGLDIKIDCLLNTWGETVAIFAGALKPTYEAAIVEAKAHYLTPKTNGEEILIASTFAKANEGLMVGLDVPSTTTGKSSTF